jgi:DNA-binding transcriptional ArsR family regulator
MDGQAARLPRARETILTKFLVQCIFPPVMALASASPPPDPGVAVLDDAARLGAVLSPLRQRMLGRLRERPDSATGLARRLGLARQKVNYHLRELERAGFLELDEERQRRGCVERRLRPTARAYLVSPALLGELTAEPEAIRDRFSSSYLIAVAARVMRDVSSLRHGAAAAGKRLPTLTIETQVRFKSAQERADFAEELSGEIARLVTKYHDETAGGRTYRLVAGAHPIRKEAQEKP